MKTSKQTETREANVSLSLYHAGQMIEHGAMMRAEGHYYRDGRDAFGRPIYAWRADRWQATHDRLDRSDRSREAAESPWFDSMGEAEAWLESRGLRLGGAYWHTARAL